MIVSIGLVACLCSTLSDSNTGLMKEVERSFLSKGSTLVQMRWEPSQWMAYLQRRAEPEPVKTPNLVLAKESSNKRLRSQRITPSKAFRPAYIDFVKGNYDLAIEGFRQFIKDYPKSSLAQQVYYYLGEAYYHSRSYTSAVQTFETLHRNYPNSRHVPSALFKLGLIMDEMEKGKKARAYWLTVSRKYPRSSEAQLAKQKLARE